MRPGAHVLVDAHGCDPHHLNDAAGLERLLVGELEAAGCTLLHLHIARFHPRGVTAAATLAESHLTLHTWPETGYAALDAFTCGDVDTERLCRRIAAHLGDDDPDVRVCARSSRPTVAGGRRG